MPLGHAGALGRRPLGIILDQPLVATQAAGIGAVIIYTVEILTAAGSLLRVATEQYATLISELAAVPSIQWLACQGAVVQVVYQIKRRVRRHFVRFRAGEHQQCQRRI